MSVPEPTRQAVDHAAARQPFEASVADRPQEFKVATSRARDLLDQHTVMIPDFPLLGTRYLDFYRTFDQYPEVRAAAVQCLATRYRDFAIDAIAGIGNGGFGLGSCLAMVLGLPFHPIRKAGDTVHGAFSVSTGMVYAKRDLTLARDVVTAGSAVVLVDDTIATGGSAVGGLKLLSLAGASVVEVATLFETTSRHGRRAIAPVPLFAVLSRDAF